MLATGWTHTVYLIVLLAIHSRSRYCPGGWRTAGKFDQVI